MTGGRIFCLHATFVGVMLLTLADESDLPVKLVYNASASAPLGWYAIEDGRDAAAGDLVVVRPPLRAETLMVERRYIAAGVPLVKFVTAVAGQRVCRDGDRISIDDHAAGEALDRDSHERPLPRWSGCRTLRPGEIFLFNGDVRGSFDGRYFGPTPAADIIGKARPLWTW